MNPLFLRLGVGIGVGVIACTTFLLLYLMRRTEPPHYTHEYTKNFSSDDATTAHICCICLENFCHYVEKKKVVVLSCGHKFHKECLKAWIEGQSSRQCPYCRRGIQDSDASQCQ